MTGRHVLDGRLAVFVHGRIDQDQRPARKGVVRGSDTGDLARPGNGARLEGTVRAGRLVAPHGLRVRAVGTHAPQVLVTHGVAVDIVPPGEQQLAVVRHRGEPFGHVVPRKLADVRTVRLHAKERVRLPAVGVAIPEATALRAATGRHERDVAVRQEFGHEVLVHAARKLLQAGPVEIDRPEVVVVVVRPLLVHRHRVGVKRTIRLHKREKRVRRVVGETRFQIAAARQAARDEIARLERASRRLQHKQACPSPA